MKSFKLGLTILVLAFTASFVQAQEEESPYSFSGAVDAYYLFGFNEATFPTSFTPDHNSFSLGMANLIFEKSGKVGFKADLSFGPRANAGNGYADQSLGLIKQLYVTYTPVDALTFTFGNFGTFVGYEVIDAPVNLNYSTSYMFSNGPFYHTGLKANVALSDKIGAMVGVFNDTDTKFDVTAGKHFGAQLSYGGDKLAAYLNFLTGKATDSLTNTQIDLTATFQATDALGLGLNATQKSYIEDGKDNSAWSGAALYANYAITEGFTLALRGEILSDTDGILFGAADNSITALTLSGNFTIGNLKIIPEFRIDSAKEDGTFADINANPLKSVPAFLTAVVYSF